MNNLIIDFETRSRVDLKKSNVYRYAEDSSTEILCCAWKWNDEPTQLWTPNIGYHVLLKVLRGADTITAHNASFERIMWPLMYVWGPFPEIPLSKWRCTAAQAAALALPRSLAELSQALDLSTKKDTEGYKVMMKLCKPGKDGNFINDGPLFERLYRYCIQDVETEHLVHKKLPPLSVAEQKLWELDQVINDRGILLDVPGATALKEQVKEHEIKLLEEVVELTQGKLKSARQRDAVIKWLQEEDSSMELEGLTKSDVEEALSTVESPKAKRLLELRQSLSKSSVKKLDAMLNLASTDGRIRGSLLFHGATTGRWSGKGIQPQNYPRDSYKTEAEVEACIRGEVEGCPIVNASKALRGLLIAPKHLAAVDFNAIEARVLAWLAGEKHVIQTFREGRDPYKVAASAIYGVSYENVTKDQRQIGKVAELALGYQGWVGAFQSMATGYGVEVSDERAKAIIIPWRENRPATVALWRGLESAAIQAVMHGAAFKFGKITFGVRGDFLFMKLPSGRMLSYPYPKIEKVETPYGEDKDALTFMSVDTYSRKWERGNTYGGKLTENAVQAIARDLLAHALTSLEALDVKTVLHVHDEIVFELDKQTDLPAIEKVISTMPAWASDCPMTAEGWVGQRYKK